MNAWLLDTDQTECYDVSGRRVSCLNSGQDAEFQYLRRTGARFRTILNVVFDDWTGLTWTRSASLAEFPLDWDDAVQFTEEMSRTKAYGRSGWRLPTRRELFSLISHQAINPALPQKNPFIDVFSGYYWTSESCARLPDQAWYIHMGGGRVYRGMRHGSYMVWPVKASKAYENSTDLRFLNTDGVIHDRLTGLMWLRKADIAGGAVKWHEAIQAVAEINQANTVGYGDWRLPNVRELESLTDIKSHSPALPQNHPFNSIQDGYWSSTTSAYEPRYAWVLYLRDGAVGVGFKSKPDFFVWAVRRFDPPKMSP